MSTTINFNGSIPQNYEEYLTKFVFESFAEDIAKRVTLQGATKVLELAAGTGVVTRQLIKILPVTTQLTATDLQEGMLEIAKKNITSPNLHWAITDMTNISYEDNLYDVIICQFGVMLVPDKLKALREMHRVLKPGGQLLFNVWGNIEDNWFWNIGSKVIGPLLQTNPLLQDPGPFSLKESSTLSLLNDAGFSNVQSIVVNKSGTIESAAMAATGFIEGLPVILAINQTNPELLPKIHQLLQQEFSRQLGNHPLQSPLQAIVFEAYK